MPMYALYALALTLILRQATDTINTTPMNSYAYFQYSINLRGFQQKSPDTEVSGDGIAVSYFRFALSVSS